MKSSKLKYSPRQLAQAQVVEELRRIWAKNPEMRFGQLLINLGIIEDERIAWSRRDEDTLERLKEWKQW